MASLKLAAILLLIGGSAFAQGQTYGLGHTPTEAELRFMDISIGPEGKELPAGRGSVSEGAQVFLNQGCVSCHGEGGIGGLAPQLQTKKGPEVPVWDKERILPLRAPSATIVWDYIRRGMPLGREGTLTNNEVYALTAYLMALNKVVPENTVLDEKSLPLVKMPIGDHYGKLPEWKPSTPRLEGYPY
jgi:cytochrome c